MKLSYTMLACVALASCSSIVTVDPFTQGCKNAPEDAKRYFESPENLKNKATYLNGAISCERLSTVKYMVESSIVNVNGNNGGDTIPLTFAAARNKKEITDFVLNHPNFNESINFQLNRALYGAFYTDAEMMQTLIEHGADVNYKENKQSVLRQHILYGELETVKYLVENGAKIENEDKNMVAHALTQSKEKTAIYLIELGFPFIEVQSQGWTPFQLAVNNNMIDAVNLILDKLPNDRIKLGMINDAIRNRYLKSPMSATLQTQKELTLARL